MKFNAKTKMYPIAVALVFLSLALSFVFIFNKNHEPHNIFMRPTNKNAASQNPYSSDEESALADSPELSKSNPSTIPIFMYHYIRSYFNTNDPIGVDLSVSPEKFEEQLAWLKNNGYHNVFPNFFNSPKPLSFAPVILTFDDGYQDAYDSAFPMLQKYQMAGIFYLIVNKIGTPGYLTWDEIREMQNAGMSFGSQLRASLRPR